MPYQKVGKPAKSPRPRRGTDSLILLILDRETDHNQKEKKKWETHTENKGKMLMRRSAMSRSTVGTAVKMGLVQGGSDEGERLRSAKWESNGKHNQTKDASSSNLGHLVKGRKEKEKCGL